MNIETHTITIFKDIEIYEKFGWKHTEDTTQRRGRTSTKAYVLARDCDMPNYRLISALEKKYFLCRSQLKSYEPISISLCIVLFVLFIIPFAIYVGFKMTQKSFIEDHNNELNAEMNNILAEVKPLLN